MLLKFLGGFIIAIGAWCLGKNVSEGYNDRIKIIDSYVLLLKNFKSAVSFSGINMYVFFSKNKDKNTKSFLDFLISKRDVQALSEFKTNNKIENKCISIIADGIILAERSSDRELISDYLEECVHKLTYYKNEVLEEYRGKIKTAPSVGLVFGIFVAILVI